MAKLKSLLIQFFTPTPFKIGLIFSCLFCIVTYLYYNVPNGRHWTIDRLRELHQKSIDIRLKDRGMRNSTGQVAIVAIDELSEEHFGRWPWPRSRIAEVIEKLVEHGAQVIAFDAVFVEPDKNHTVETLNRLKSQFSSNPQLENVIQTELAKANTDWMLADTVEKHADKVVLGTYFESPSDMYLAYQERCGALLSQTTSQYKVLENEERPMIAVDSNDFILPDFFKEQVLKRFKEIDYQVRTRPESSGKDELSLKKEIFEEQSNFCNRWLSTQEPFKDETYPRTNMEWQTARKEIPEWQNLSLDEASDVIRANSYHNRILRTGRWWLNLPIISEKSKHSGYFVATQDPDGTVRRSRLVVRYGDLYLPSLALKAILVAKNLSAMIHIDPDITSSKDQILTKLALIDENGTTVQEIPVSEDGTILVNYLGDRYSHPHISIYELFNGSEEAKITIREDGIVKTKTVKKDEFLKDKILLVGATSVGTYDLRVTPFSENFPGVETHANFIENILTQNYLRHLPDEAYRMLIFIIVLGLTLSYLISTLGALLGALASILALIGIYIVDRFYFFKNGLVTTVVLPILLVIGLYILLTFYKYLTEERKKKLIKGTFEKYVSPAIVNEVLKHPDNISLGGRKQKMTVMFSDVRGFTTISEKLDPQLLVQVLNEYLTPMTNLVFHNKGTLDKYMGDAIMAFFGAPLAYEEHAKMGCKCALEMMELLPEINKDFEEKGLPRIDIGIGLNTGEMSVGNMGSDTVRSYTVMGDAVNLGSRLEGINKEYGTRIIISEYTQKEVEADFVTREVDWVRVKGKKQPVRIFELMATAEKTDELSKIVDPFNKGFQLYHDKKWQEAEGCFQQVLQVRPDDGPSLLYLKRIHQYKQEPPEENWDGVYEMKTK